MAAQYETSLEFTEDLMAVLQKLHEVNAIINKPEFIEWVKTTDQNYGTICGAILWRLSTNELAAAIEGATVLSDEIEKAV